jgi:hypothetical protein
VNDETTATSVLEHYGTRVPEAIGYTAYHYGTPKSSKAIPEQLVSCRRDDGGRLRDDLSVFRVHGYRDGLLVELVVDNERTYYALPDEGVVQAVVKRLVDETDWLVAVDQHEYPPSFEDGDAETTVPTDRLPPAVIARFTVTD